MREHKRWKINVASDMLDYCWLSLGGAIFCRKVDENRVSLIVFRTKNCVEVRQNRANHKLVQAFLANVNSRSRSLYAIARPPVVCLSVCRLSVTFVRPTQAVQIFGNISTALGTLAIHGHPLKILRRSSQGNPSAGGVKDKRGSKI